MELITGEEWRSRVSPSLAEKARGGHLPWEPGDVAACSSLGCCGAVGLDLFEPQAFSGSDESCPPPACKQHTRTIAFTRPPPGAQLGP